MRHKTTAGAACALLALGVGCGSSGSSAKPAAKSVESAGPAMAENRKHPLAKFIEIAGFRISEPKPGRLKVEFAVINHSDADVSDLGLNVALRPTTAKPDDPPFCTVTVKLPSLAPQSLKDASGECGTKLRVYELPDWQFLRPSFQITSPPM
jgi:hypothetical protein